MSHKKSLVCSKICDCDNQAKYFLIFSILYFLLSYIILYFNSQQINTIREHLYDADQLFPFSLFQGVLAGSSINGWMFSGVIPIFPDLFFLALFWMISKNIHLTIVLYAIFQPVFLVLCMVFLCWCVIGRNDKIYSFIFLFSALPMMLISSGKFFTFFYIFTWYKHVGLIGLEFIAIGLITLYFKKKNNLFHKKQRWVLIELCTLTIVASASDPLFITQFVAPIAIVLIVLFFVGIVPKKNSMVIQTILLISAGIGLSLYKFPVLFLSYRIHFFDSYVNPNLERIMQNWISTKNNLASLWDYHDTAWGVWILFYICCFLISGSIIYYYRNKQHDTKNLIVIIILFFLVQFGISICIPVIMGSIAPWYFHPIVFIPLFWGWPFIFIVYENNTNFSNYLNFLVLGFVALGIIVSLRVVYLKSNYQPVNLLDYYPDYVKCIDEKASDFGLHYGIANYWQARQITLLSKSGLKALQVTSSLSPFHWENNLEGYDRDLNFIVIDHSALPDMILSKEIVTSSFGNPIQTIFCGKSEILLYNQSNKKLPVHP